MKDSGTTNSKERNEINKLITLVIILINFGVTIIYEAILEYFLD
jgi:hypothetical protein